MKSAAFLALRRAQRKLVPRRPARGEWLVAAWYVIGIGAALYVVLSIAFTAK